MTGRYRPLFMLFVVSLAVLACGFPGPTSQPSAVARATVEEATATPEPLPTEAPAADIAAVVAVDGHIELLRLDGTSAGTWDAPGIDSPRPDRVQVAGSSVYYVNDAGTVSAVTATGVSDLSFTGMPNLSAIAVSPDEGSIAWSTSTYAEGVQSQLWLAAIDGSGMQMVAASDPADEIADWFTLEPVGFGADGQLVYAWQITGIGGYILFFGYSSLYSYDPATAIHTPMAPLASDSTGPCWSGVKADLTLAVGHCVGPDGALAMRERNLATGIEAIFPEFPEQGQAGAGTYSPSGNRLAYAIARGNPDDEAGQIIVRLAPDSAPTPIASIAPGYFHSLYWLDEDRLLAGGYVNGADTVFLVGVDGSLVTVAEGPLAGWMRLP